MPLGGVRLCQMHVGREVLTEREGHGHVVNPELSNIRAVGNGTVAEFGDLVKEVIRLTIRSTSVDTIRLAEKNGRNTKRSRVTSSGVIAEGLGVAVDVRLGI